MQTSEMITILAAVLGSGVLGAFVTALFNKRKTDADASGKLTNTALSLVEKLEEKVTRMEAGQVKDRQELAKTRQELEDTKDFVEDIAADHMKVQLAFYINTLHMQKKGIEPPIKIEELADMTTRELKKMSKRLGVTVPGASDEK